MKKDLLYSDVKICLREVFYARNKIHSRRRICCVLKIEFDVVIKAYSCQPLHKSTQP